MIYIKARNIKNSLVFIMMFIYIIIYQVLIRQHLQEYSEIITASFLIILASIIVALMGFVKDKKTALKTVILKNTLFYIIITFCVIYGLGFFVGFLKNAYSLKPLQIFNNMLGPIFIILFSEVIRYLVISTNKDKKYPVILITILLTILELVTSLRTGWYLSFSTAFKTTTSLILPVILKNALLSYLCYETGIRSPLAYRLVLDLYCYILPIFPDLGDYLNSMILISLPILIYVNSSNIINEYRHGIERKFNFSKFSVWDTFSVVLIAVLAILISGYFKYFMIGVGSESMTPKINKGDAIIVKKIESKNELEVGQVIAFKIDNKTVIHRLVRIEKENGKIYYVTKGDANNAEDNFQIEEEDIRGVVKFKIPYIAYPSVLLSELLS